MKSFKILITAFAMVVVLFTGCKKAVVTGIDFSKAGVKDFTYDEDNSSSTSIAFYWDGAEAIKAGATSFSVQLATKADFTDIDMYNSSIGQTVQASAKVNDAVVMSGLAENTWYYARIRANYPRSIYSDWTNLIKDGAVICIAVGHGIVVMDFVTPQGLTAKPLKYNKFSAAWGIVAPADGYAPEYKKASDSAWIPLPESEDAGFTIADATPETEYNVRVRAFRTLDGGSKEYTEYAETSVVTPEKKEHNLSTAEDVKAFFNGGIETSTNSDVYYLKANVDLAGATLAGATSFPGEFLGGGFTIKNAVVDKGIADKLDGSFTNVKFESVKFKCAAFGEITADAEVADVAFESNCTFEIATPTGGGIGILANTNYGTVTNCTTAVNVDQTLASVPAEECYIGGLIGMSKGNVTGCENKGSFAISITAPTKSSYHWMGGVVGQVTGSAGKTLIKNCKNSGKVALTYKSAVYFCVGGVTGGTPAVAGASGNYGIIDNCDNTAEVSIHYIDGGSGAYPNIGGTAGYVEGAIQNCDNSGKISLICDSEANTWTNARLAGVAGSVTRGAKDCTNKGQLYIKALTAGGTAGNRLSGNTASTCVAGVIAAAGPYDTHSADIVFEGLKNEANLEITPSSTTGTPNSYYAGCLGYVTGSVKGCVNTGNITVSSPIAVNRLAGIAGGVVYNITDCTNSGTLSITQDLTKASGSVGSFRVYIGGICGEYEGAKATVANCSNSGNGNYVCKPAASAATSSRTSGMAGILGNDTNGNSTVDGCTNTGKFTFSGNSKVQTSEISNVGLN